jgi:hypothetical protein
MKEFGRRSALVLPLLLLVLATAPAPVDAKRIIYNGLYKATNFLFVGKFCFDVKGGSVRIAAALPKYYATYNVSENFFNTATNKSDVRFVQSTQQVNSSLHAETELLFFTDLDESWGAVIGEVRATCKARSELSISRTKVGESLAKIIEPRMC